MTMMILAPDVRIVYLETEMAIRERRVKELIALHSTDLMIQEEIAVLEHDIWDLRDEITDIKEAKKRGKVIER